MYPKKGQCCPHIIMTYFYDHSADYCALTLSKFTQVFFNLGLICVFINVFILLIYLILHQHTVKKLLTYST